jgi:hypothetical protein
VRPVDPEDSRHAPATHRVRERLDQELTHAPPE